MARPLLHSPLALIFCSLGCKPHLMKLKVMNHANRISDSGLTEFCGCFWRFARALRHISQAAWGWIRSTMVWMPLSSLNASACFL